MYDRPTGQIRLSQRQTISTTVSVYESAVNERGIPSMNLRQTTTKRTRIPKKNVRFKK